MQNQVIVPSREKRQEIIHDLRIIYNVIYKAPKLLIDSTVSRFLEREWIEVNNLSSDHFSVNKKVRFKTVMIKSDLCDFSYAYIVVKERVTAEGNDGNNRVIKKSISRNKALFV